MNYVLAIDQGTSSTRAMLYTLEGQLKHVSQFPLTQYYPKSGWVEHDPEEIWQTTKAAIREVASKVAPEKIVACGLTNQRETTLLWDRDTGECLHSAIVWQDRRTHSYCQSLIPEKQMIHQKTGLFPDAYFSASKIKWLLENIPQARQLVARNRLAFGTIDSFLIWRLTGGKAHCTDVTNASRTLLYNIIDHNWDEELLKLFSIPSSILPEVLDCDGMFGALDKDILGVSIPITGVAGDQQAALIGLRCFRKGMVKATFGTGGFLLLNTGHKPVFSSHNLLTTVGYRLKACTSYGLEGSLYQAGSTIKWLRDQMKLIMSASETESLAKSLSSNEGVYLVPSFTGLGAPHWLSVNGALIVGLSQASNAAHFARAALESVCYQTRDVLTCMREDSNMELSLLRVDGGMAENQWLLQFLASQCGLRVQRPANIETTAIGAALIATIGVGAMDSLDELHENWKCEREFMPQDTPEHVQRDYAGWLNALAKVFPSEYPGHIKHEMV